jgi:hypothetical protein
MLLHTTQDRRLMKPLITGADSSNKDQINLMGMGATMGNGQWAWVPLISGTHAHTPRVVEPL